MWTTADHEPQLLTKFEDGLQSLHDVDVNTLNSLKTTVTLALMK